jgi:hypothetical protein
MPRKRHRRGHIVSFEPSVRGAYWRLSQLFSGRGEPFYVEKMVLGDPEGDPPLRPLTFVGEVGLGTTQRPFEVPLRVPTEIASRVDVWSESEAVAFLELAWRFADHGMSFAVHEMVAEPLTREGFESFGDKKVRSVLRTVRFTGDCGCMPHHQKFEAEVYVYDNEELKTTGEVESFGWDMIGSKILINGRELPQNR